MDNEKREDEGLYLASSGRLRAWGPSSWTSPTHEGIRYQRHGAQLLHGEIDVTVPADIRVECDGDEMMDIRSQVMRSQPRRRMRNSSDLGNSLRRKCHYQSRRSQRSRMDRQAEGPPGFPKSKYRVRSSRPLRDMIVRGRR